MNPEQIKILSDQLDDVRENFIKRIDKLNESFLHMSYSFNQLLHEDIEEIPQFKGTKEALDKLTITEDIDVGDSEHSKIVSTPVEDDKQKIEEDNDTFLRDYHAKTFTQILDDDLPDHFDNWISELTYTELTDIINKPR